MAIHPILTLPAQVNNISEKTYINNGYNGIAYEITIFNNKEIECLHDANITHHMLPKR
jgi:hypothetical protein